MGKTIRGYHRLSKSWNPYYYTHELKSIRTTLHRKFRHFNRIAIQKGIDVEKEPKTNGWITY